jgi:hypothetical protein
MLTTIQVALASGSGHFVDIVREAQLGLDLLDLRTADAKGLHLTTQAQVQPGEIMADTFLQLLPSTGHPILSRQPPYSQQCSQKVFQFYLGTFRRKMCIFYYSK